MSHSNVADAPMFKITDRDILRKRILGALLADPDCRYTFRGDWKPLTADEQANWDARTSLSGSTASTPDEPPPTEVEPLHTEPIDNPTEA